MKLGDVARNPLGIIGLFISLIYGFANWMLGSTANTLSSCERIIIIWFIVLFPILILAAFCYLVVKHHGKLYAPKDYNRDESFLQTLSPFDSFARLSAETSTPDHDASGESTSVSDDPNSQIDQRSIPVSENEEQANSNVNSTRHPHNLPPQPLEEGGGVSATENAEVLDHTSDSAIQATVNDIDLIEHAKQQKKLSQMKELFELTQHFIKTDKRFAGVDVKSDVKMGSTGVVYDAAAYTDSGLQCLEVKYVRSANELQRILSRCYAQVHLVRAAVSPADFHLRLVIVYAGGLGPDRVYRDIISSFSNSLQGIVKIELVARSSVAL
ncbi:hypothetical protein [Pseudomonas alabamensis]|uniref:hypothetical protein n=1 Tax=Pseudomonas alabamensis TaxID=3064349 RepID=UPI003F651A89